jgi:hypothetical protein
VRRGRGAQRFIEPFASVGGISGVAVMGSAGFLKHYRNDHSEHDDGGLNAGSLKEDVLR